MGFVSHYALNLGLIYIYIILLQFPFLLCKHVMKQNQCTGSVDKIISHISLTKRWERLGWRDSWRRTPWSERRSREGLVWRGTRPGSSPRRPTGWPETWERSGTRCWWIFSPVLRLSNVSTRWLLSISIIFYMWQSLYKYKSIDPYIHKFDPLHFTNLLINYVLFLYSVSYIYLSIASFSLKYKEIPDFTVTPKV